MSISGQRRPMTWRSAVVVAAMAIAACSDPGRTEAQSSVGWMDDDDFPGSCRGTGTDGGTDTDPCDTDGTGDAPVGAATDGAATEPQAGCRASTECMGGSCAAPYDPDNQQRGSFECRFVCVPNLDEQSWCADDSSCCDPQATCTARGYCLVEPTGSSGDSTSSTGGTSG